jgi:malonate-semialdehyde dehydrogenase (acetylating)/methylmalonate-semialdehyde dehydrogenase
MFSLPRTLLSHQNRFDCFTLLFVCHRTPGGFGGLYSKKSKYGDVDITGDGAIKFFTNRIKITSKWPAPSVPEYIAGLTKKQWKDSIIDHANFAGTM